MTELLVVLLPRMSEMFDQQASAVAGMCAGTGFRAVPGAATPTELTYRGCLISLRCSISSGIQHCQHSVTQIVRGVYGCFLVADYYRTDATIEKPQRYRT